MLTGVRLREQRKEQDRASQQRGEEALKNLKAILANSSIADQERLAKARADEEHRRKIERFRQSNLPKRYAKAELHDFKLPADAQDIVDTVKNVILNKAGVYIYGEVGTGKTLMACIMSREILKRGRIVRFYDCNQLLTDVNPYYSGDAELSNRLKRTARTVPVLVLDDIGAQRNSPQNCAALFDIINARYNDSLQTIATSNIALDDFLKSSNLTERRIASRFSEMCNLLSL